MQNDPKFKVLDYGQYSTEDEQFSDYELDNSDVHGRRTPKRKWNNAPFNF